MEAKCITFVIYVGHNIVAFSWMKSKSIYIYITPSTLLSPCICLSDADLYLKVRSIRSVHCFHVPPLLLQLHIKCIPVVCILGLQLVAPRLLFLLLLLNLSCPDIIQSSLYKSKYSHLGREVNNISNDDKTFIKVTSTPNYGLNTDGLRLSMYAKQNVIDILSSAFVTKLIKTSFSRKFSLLRAMGHCEFFCFGSFASMRKYCSGVLSPLILTHPIYF